MKKIIGLVLGMAIFGCQDNENAISEFTGNEVVYSLQQGGVYVINGTVSLKEKKDGSSVVTISLNGTEGDIQLPVHLHLGDISAPDAEVAALLNPVLGSTGKSETHLKRLANEELISFKDLIALEASIKIHLGESGPDRNVILAAGNIGTAGSTPNGRSGISVCRSE